MRTVIPLRYWAALILGTIVLISSTQVAYAEPLYQTQGEPRVTLYKGGCKLDAVMNLPHRATWTEGWKVIEGCWVGRSDTGVVLAYFADRTAVAIPMSVFHKVSNA